MHFSKQNDQGASQNHGSSVSLPDNCIFDTKAGSPESIRYAVLACLPYTQTLQEMTWMLPYVMNTSHIYSKRLIEPNRHLHAFDLAAKIIGRTLPELIKSIHPLQSLKADPHTDRYWDALIDRPIPLTTSPPPDADHEISIRIVIQALNSLDPSTRHTLFQDAFVNIPPTFNTKNTVKAVRQFTEVLAAYLPTPSLSFSETCTILAETSLHLDQILSAISARILLES